MRQLFPVAVDGVDVLAAYDDTSRAAAGRPYVFVNMIASADGATAADGVTAPLASAGDRQVFFLLRSLADVILVGAQTVRAERYGPSRLSAEAVARRTARGQTAQPAIAVVSGSLDLDWSSAFFTEASSPPVVLAPATADPERLRAAGEVADVVVAGDGRVDLTAALAALHQRGVRTVLCEGGPTLNGVLAEQGLVDELCLTLAPRLLGGGAAPILGSNPLAGMVELSLLHVLEEEGFLFLRYGHAGQP